MPDQKDKKPVEKLTDAASQAVQAEGKPAPVWCHEVTLSQVTLVIITGSTILLIFGLNLRWKALMALVAALFSIAINVLIIDLVQRPRPKPNLVNVFAKLPNYSFLSEREMLYIVFLVPGYYFAKTILKTRFSTGVHWHPDSLYRCPASLPG